MSMSADLRDRLKAAGIASGAVFRDEIPQGTTGGRVRMQVVSDPRPYTLDGRQAFRETRVQFDCMAGSRGEADEIADALIDAAEPPATIGGTKFSHSFVDSQRTYSERDDKSGLTTFVNSLDLMVWHSPAA